MLLEEIIQTILKRFLKIIMEKYYRKKNTVSEKLNNGKMVKRKEKKVLC